MYITYNGFQNITAINYMNKIITEMKLNKTCLQ